MRLIGSKLESDYRKVLIDSQTCFHSASKIFQAFDLNGHLIANSFVLHHTPNQMEDFYVILINGLYIVCVEVERYAPTLAADIERIELADYKRKLSSTRHVKLLVALNLISLKTLQSQA